MIKLFLVALLLTVSMLARGASSSEPGAVPAVGVRAVLEDRYPVRAIMFQGDVTGYPDLVYSTLPGYRPLHLDLYVPSGHAGTRPLVIYIHGGGWTSGHTRHCGAFENWPGVLASLAAKGYVVASVEYRLSGEARFPAALEDIKASIRWLRAHAAEYGIDKGRAVVWGASAGGQLAALAATKCEDDKSDCVQGLIAWYGIFDFPKLITEAAAAGRPISAATSAPGRYLGCAPSSCSKETLEAASAAHFADAQSPPALLVHGGNDHTVPTQQSRDFSALLQSKGITVEYLEIPGVDHSFIGTTADATRAASLKALQASFAFIDRTVGQSRTAGRP